jgi:MFS family permease
MSWGILASLQSTSTGFGDLLFLRALLGVSEAAFGPGVPFYLSFFFRRDELALRTGLFISAAPLATSFASSLAWLITKLGEGGPLAPWRLLFLVEGFPSVLVAVWAWEFIPDSPGTASFLSPRLRDVAVFRLRQEKEANYDVDFDVGNENRGYTSEKKGRVIFTEVLQTLKDPKCYLTAVSIFNLLC